MINPKKRFEILKRDGFRCMYCGKTGKDVTLEIDHIIPKSKGGSDDTNNLITCCRECNMGKGKTRLDSVELWKDKIDDLKNRLKKDFNKKRNGAQLGMIKKNTYILLCNVIDFKVDLQYSPNSIDARDEMYFHGGFDFAGVRPIYTSDERCEYGQKLEKEFKLGGNFCDACCEWSYNGIIMDIDDFISNICDDSGWTGGQISNKGTADRRLNYLMTRELMWYYARFKEDNTVALSLKFIAIKYTYRRDRIEHFENEGE